MPNSVQLMFERAISIDVPLSGHRLVPGIEGSFGLPVEAFLRLYAVDASGSARRMQSLVEVLALVEAVRSEKEALQLLQLETSPETHFLFPNCRDLDVRLSRSLKKPGDLTERGAAAAGYRAPSCVAVAEGFDVCRDLVRIDPADSPMLVRRKEHLSRTAEYHLVSETVIGSIERSEIVLPRYE